MLTIRLLNALLLELLPDLDAKLLSVDRRNERSLVIARQCNRMAGAFE